MSPRRRFLRSSSGFSLMEMLMVAAILPVVFFAVFANMSSGMRTWKTLNQPLSQEDTVLFLDRTRTDFANAFLFSSIPFLGDAQSVTFAGLIQTDKTLGGERGIGRVTYRFNDSTGAILRQESNISEVYKDAPPRSKPVLSGVTSFSIEYLSYLPTEDAYVWKDVWQPGKRPLPAAVRLTISRSSGEELVKSFLVPVGN